MRKLSRNTKNFIFRIFLDIIILLSLVYALFIDPHNSTTMTTVIIIISVIISHYIIGYILIKHQDKHKKD